jgi:hypothetical protein
VSPFRKLPGLLNVRCREGFDCYSVPIRVTKPHALVMLKLLALDDRYRNIQGPAEARHDREEARGRYCCNSQRATGPELVSARF